LHNDRQVRILGSLNGSNLVHNDISETLAQTTQFFMLEGAIESMALYFVTTFSHIR